MMISLVVLGLSVGVLVGFIFGLTITDGYFRKIMESKKVYLVVFRGISIKGPTIIAVEAPDADEAVAAAREIVGSFGKIELILQTSPLLLSLGVRV